MQCKERVMKMTKIKELRMKAGLSQKDLAIEMNVAQPTASGWENGTKFPSSSKLKKLATLLNTSIDELLEDKKFYPDDLDVEEILDGLATQSIIGVDSMKELDGLYLRLAKGAQNLALDEEDVDYILNFYKKYKK